MTEYVGEYRSQADMVVGYRLDRLHDYSGNEKTLTNNGTVAFSAVARPDGTTGKVAAFGSPNSSKCLDVTSTSQADIDINLTSNAVTLAAWIYISALPSAGDYPTIVHWDSHETDDRYVALWYKNDGGTYKLQADFSGNVTTYSVTLTVDTWYWVVLTAAAGAGGATALYLNGTAVASGTKGTSAGAGTTKFQIAKHIGESQYWPGNLYQIAAYKKVFTATEILTWYNHQVGTAYDDIYVSIDGTDLTSYVDSDEGLEPSGADLQIDENSASGRDFPVLVDNGRGGRKYDFKLMTPTRTTLETLLGVINNADEYTAFTPYTQDRYAYLKRASAVITNPFRHWDSTVQEFRWYYGIDCDVRVQDSLLYSARKTLFTGEEVILPTEDATVTNNGTYKAGFDYFEAVGCYASSVWSDDLTLTLNDIDYVICDRLHHGETITVNRFGVITQSYYTDFDITEANLQSYLDSAGAATVASAGYHIGGENPNLISKYSGDADRFRIMADSSTSWTTIDIQASNCTSLARTVQELQTWIQAAGGNLAAVTAILSSNRIKIISGTTGIASKIRITCGPSSDDCAHYLKIGTGTWEETELIGEDHDGTDAATPYITVGSGTAGYHTSDDVPATIISGAGFHASGADPATVLSSGYGTSGKLKIQADSEAAATEITLTLSSCTSGDATASHLQTQIRAIGAAYAKVVARYENGRYLIVSQKTSSDSKIRITAGATVDVSAYLKLGTANGGTNYDGSATVKNKFAIQADSEASPSTVTLTLTQAYTNDPGTGAVQLNMADTSMFAAADVVVVSSGTGYEVATITSVEADHIHITVALDHNTSSRAVNPYCNGTQIARLMQKYVRAIGGAYDNITVTYDAYGHYVITSETSGVASKIRITSDGSNDIADRLKIGTANGGTDTDGTVGSVAKNACVLSRYGRLLMPFCGPLQISRPPKLEFWVNSLTGTPKIVYLDDDGEYVYLDYEIVQGQNKVWIADLQGEADVRFGIYCDQDSSISLYDMDIEIGRDVSPAYFPTVDPGETAEFSVSCGGSAKLSSMELYYRDAFWS